jgi:quercetin dioxygenase-like cupin family protein
MITLDASLPVGLHVVRVQPVEAGVSPHEVTVLADLDAVRIVQISLRGAGLSRHTASTPVTLQAVHGDPCVVVDDVEVHLGDGTFVVLDAGTPHAVRLVGSDPVVLLVHQHKVALHPRAAVPATVPGHEPGPDVMTP